MASPQVSIIVPAYNAAKYIGATIESAFDQSFRDFEIIIIDDGSSDNTRAIVDTYRDDRIIVLSQSNSGIGAARNRGINRARGMYISLLDSDDLWEPQYLEKMMKFFDNNPTVSIAFSDACYFGESKFAGHRFQEIYPPSTPITFAKVAGRISHVAIFATFRSEIIKKVGYFDEKNPFTGAEDFDYWLRALHAGCRIEPVREVLVQYRRHASSISMKMGQLERAGIGVLEKWRNSPALTKDERDAVESTYRELRWYVNTRDALYHIYEKRYGLAKESLRCACEYRAPWHYRVARMGLTIAPQIVNRIIHFYDFLVFIFFCQTILSHCVIELE